MAIRHNPIIIANARFTNACNCSCIKCCKFTNGVTITNNKLSRLIAVFFILRLHTQTGELENFIVLTYCRMPFNHSMCANFRACINLHICANNGISTHFHTAI